MTELLKIIQQRQSLRMPFDNQRPVPKEALLQILEAARWTPTAHNMQNFEIVVVDDKKQIEAISAIPRPISEVFIRENYHQLSFSEEELMKKKTGLLGTMFPPEWLNPDFKFDNKAESDLAVQRSLPACSLLLVVVYDPSKRAPASEGDFLGIISLGCAMENMWLMANSLGIGFHIVSSLSAVESEKEVKEILNIPKHLKMAFTCRLGYPLATPSKSLRVRRDINDFASHNIYGNKDLE